LGYETVLAFHTHCEVICVYLSPQRADLAESPPTLDLPCYTWLLIDGPIDSVWIESINSVLDDSRTLCLANNERVKLSPNMRLLFEVGDLSAASPAAVSRLGVVYVAQDDLGWQPFVQVRSFS
jgi:hypothetical protein